VLSDLSSAKDPASRALTALAHHSLGNERGAEQARELAEKDGEDGIVQVVCGTVLAAVGEYERAVELLGKHQGNLEAWVEYYLI
jgi:coatomer subunit epsilon